MTGFLISISVALTIALGSAAAYRKLRWSAILIFSMGILGLIVGAIPLWLSLIPDQSGKIDTGLGQVLSWCSIPACVVFGLVLASVIGYSIDHPARRLQPREIRCPSCGYSLKGLRTRGCPECGWRRKNIENPEVDAVKSE